MRENEPKTFVRSFVRMHSWRTPDDNKSEYYSCGIRDPDSHSRFSLLHLSSIVTSFYFNHLFLGHARRIYGNCVLTVAHRNRSLYARCRIWNTKSNLCISTLPLGYSSLEKYYRWKKKKKSNNDSDIFYKNLFYIFTLTFEIIEIKLLCEIIF